MQVAARATSLHGDRMYKNVRAVCMIITGSSAAMVWSTIRSLWSWHDVKRNHFAGQSAQDAGRCNGVMAVIDWLARRVTPPGTVLSAQVSFKPFKHEIHLNNIYIFSSNPTENTMHLYYEEQPVNAV
jgi:hypothetical protein